MLNIFHQCVKGEGGGGRGTEDLFCLKGGLYNFLENIKGSQLSDTFSSSYFGIIEYNNTINTIIYCIDYSTVLYNVHCITKSRKL